MAREWHERQDLAWAKIWDEWWTSPSHLELDAVELGIGVRLLLLANRRGRAEDGAGWCIGATGRPLSTAVLARECHATSEQVEVAVDALIAVGTMARRDDGAVGFPRLKAYQEDPSAERQRRRRSADRDTERDTERDSHADCHAESHAQTIRRQTSDDQTSDPPRRPPPAGGRSPPKGKKPRAEWFLGATERAGQLGDVALVVEAHRRHHPRARPGPLIRGLVAERLLGDGRTVDELVEAIDGYNADDWHVRTGKCADLEYVMRDDAQVEAGRAKLAHVRRGGSTGEPRREASTWSRVLAKILATPHGQPVELGEDRLLHALRAIGGQRIVRQAHPHQLRELEARFTAALDAPRGGRSPRDAGLVSALTKGMTP